MRKVLADEHGQHIMSLAKDLQGAGGMLSGGWDEFGTEGGVLASSDQAWGHPSMWHFGYLFSQALTIGGGTGDVQRNILGERVLGFHTTSMWNPGSPGSRRARSV